MLHTKKHDKKIIALVLLSVFLLALSYFTVYEDTHIIHQCTGSECTVCHELHIAESFTKQVLLAAAITAACILYVVTAHLAGTVISSSISGRTLIMDKVRIDD